MEKRTKLLGFVAWRKSKNKPIHKRERTGIQNVKANLLFFASVSFQDCNCPHLFSISLESLAFSS
jgi:hypothetical protein